MKRFTLIVVGLGIVIVIGVAHKLGVFTNTEEYQAPEVIEKVVEKQTDLQQKQLDLRLEEAMERIDQEADAIRADYVQNERAKEEAKFWREVAEQAEAKAVEKEKETGVY